MSRKYKAVNPDGTYFITCTIVDWISLLNRPVYKHIIIDSLNFCIKSKGLEVYGYVIMENHIHLIVSATEGNLPGIVRDFKQFTSKRLIQAIKINPKESRKDWLIDRFRFVGSNSRNEIFKVWQDGYHSKEISTRNQFEQKLNYIHQNPVRAEIVFNPEEYRYSSAVDYAGGKSYINIQLA